MIEAAYTELFIFIHRRSANDTHYAHITILYHIILIIGLPVSKDNRFCAGESVVRGTAPAVTVQTNSGGDSPFYRFCSCAVFNILSLLSPLHPGCVSLLLAGLHSHTHHIPRSAVVVSHDVVLMLQAFVSRLHTSLKRSIGRPVGLEPILSSL